MANRERGMPDDMGSTERGDMGGMPDDRDRSSGDADDVRGIADRDDEFEDTEDIEDEEEDDEEEEGSF